MSIDAIFFATYQGHCCCPTPKDLQIVFETPMLFECPMDELDRIFHWGFSWGSLCSNPEMPSQSSKFDSFLSLSWTHVSKVKPMPNRYQVNLRPSPSSIRSPRPWPAHEPIERLSPGPKGKGCWIFFFGNCWNWKMKWTIVRTWRCEFTSHQIYKL